MRALLLALVATTAAVQAQPAVQGFTFPNGLRLLLLEEHERPLVRARLHLRVDPADTPPGRQGLRRLLLRMLRHSEAADLRAEDLDRLEEDAGIRATLDLDAGGLSWRLVARSRDQERAMGLLADRLLRALFDPAVMELQRLATWQEVEAGGAPPRRRLRQALLQAPESRPTQASLGAISPEELEAFRTQVLRPDRAVLVLHGDLGLEQAKRLVLLSLGSWTNPAVTPLMTAPQGQAAPPGPRIPAAGGLRVEAVAARPPDLAPEVVALLHLLLPGGELAPLVTTFEEGCLVATLDAEGTLSGPASWSLLHGRLEALRRRGFAPADLERARAAWLARRSLASLHPEVQMEAALAQALGQGPSEARMRGLSLEVLNAGLRRWLDPARLRSGAAGDPDLLKTLP